MGAYFLKCEQRKNPCYKTRADEITNKTLKQSIAPPIECYCFLWKVVNLPMRRE
jgi:hypothetical protein